MSARGKYKGRRLRATTGRITSKTPRCVACGKPAALYAAHTWLAGLCMVCADIRKAELRPDGR